MICNCGGSSEYMHKVTRKKKLQGEYQKCPACGRILWVWHSESLIAELQQEREYSRTVKNGDGLLIF